MKLLWQINFSSLPTTKRSIISVASFLGCPSNAKPLLYFLTYTLISEYKLNTSFIIAMV